MAATLFSRIYGVNVFEPTLGWAEKVAFRHGLRKRHMSLDGVWLLRAALAIPPQDSSTDFGCPK